MHSRKDGILTIAYYFDPNTAVGALRPRRFHIYLRELGYDSRVVAAFVNPKEDDPHVFHLPDVVEEQWEQRIQVRATGKQPAPLSFDGQIERLIRKTFMPGHSGWIWSRQVAAYATKLHKSHRSFTTVLSSYPAIGTHLAALQVARGSGCHWIADFRDPFPFNASPLVQWSQNRAERMFFRRADAIIANTEPAAAQWREQYPWAAHKIHVIWNGYDPSNEAKAQPPMPDNVKRLVHAGNLYAGRNANILIAAIARLRERSAPNVEALRIILAGPVAEDSGVDRGLYARAVSEKWLEFDQLSIPKADAVRMTQEANGLLLLQPQSAIQVPAKLFEYASIGRPILALAPRGSSIEWILERSGLPYVCVYPEGSVDIAADKVSDFLRLPEAPTAANDWFRQRFNARAQTETLADIIEAINR